MMKLKKHNKVCYKKGVSLIVLIVTIVVMLILTTIVVVSVDNVIENSALSSFATDLSIVEDLTNVYYMQNGSMPTKIEGEAALSQNEVLAKVGIQKETAFTDELKLNNDYNEENGDLGSFYIIDLTKLDIDSSTRGFLKDGYQRDVYIVSFPSMNVYYIEGVEVKGINYFSLSSKLTDKVKIQKNTIYDSGNDVVVQTVEGLTVKKLTKNWTNSMGISVSVNMSMGEDLYLEASGVEKKKLSLNSGYNEFSFNDLSEITGFSDSDSTTFKNSEQQNKKLVFTKQNGADEIGKLEVDMTNYETTEPSFQVDPNNIVSNEEYNMVPFRAFDSISGIKEIRYDYLKKFDKNGNVVNYYENINSFDQDFLRSRGKKAVADKDGNVALKVDKEIEGIQILVIDKAGNVNTTAFTIGMYDNDNIYIGLNLMSNSPGYLEYSVILVNQKGISNIELQTSIDGNTYSAAQVINVNSSSSERIKVVNNVHENVEQLIKYLKIKATNNSNATQVSTTRVFKLEPKGFLKVGSILSQSSTFDMSENSTYDNPIIPKGFAPINVGDAIWGNKDSWNKGLVIADSSGNEFVWIPVKNSSDYKKDFTFTGVYEANSSNTLDDTLPSGVSSEIYDVSKYGGFYIARYEAGIPNGDTATSNKVGVPVSKKNQIAWASISYANSKSSAEAMINNDTVCTGLVTFSAWDTMCHFLEDEVDITDSRSYGNYQDSIFPDEQQGDHGLVKNTGSNDIWMVKNIYDVAGNVWEFTNTRYNTNNYVYKGGAFNNNGSERPVTYFGSWGGSDWWMQSNGNHNIGFRVRLYIK